jgi:hypothetical protein
MENKKINVFYYWDGPMHGYIQACIKTFYKFGGNNIEIIKITKENVKDYLGENYFADNFNNFRLHMQADGIRGGF